MDLTVPTGTSYTIIDDWFATPNPPYHENTGQWNLGAGAGGGIYTATTNQILDIRADISWMGGISNVGTREMQIVYYPGGVGPIFVVCDSVMQASATTSFPTVQSLQNKLRLLSTDQVWVQIRHTAPVALTIAGDDTNCINGSSMV